MPHSAIPDNGKGDSNSRMTGCGVRPVAAECNPLRVEAAPPSRLDTASRWLTASSTCGCASADLALKRTSESGSCSAS